MFKIVLVLRSQQDLAHLDGAAAELAVFRRAWAVELPCVVLAKSESLFTGCTVCSYLQGLIGSCPRDQKVVMQALRARLGKHFSFQGAQRLAIQKIQESARRSDGDEWILGSDKIPRIKYLMFTRETFSHSVSSVHQIELRRVSKGDIDRQDGPEQMQIAMYCWHVTRLFQSQLPQ